MKIEDTACLIGQSDYLPKVDKNFQFESDLQLFLQLILSMYKSNEVFKQKGIPNTSNFHNYSELINNGCCLPSKQS